MDLKSSLGSNGKLTIPAVSLANGGGVFSESLSSRISLKKEENLGSILRMAQLNTNLASGFMNTPGVGKSSNLRSSVVHEAAVSINLPSLNSADLPSNCINNVEPCISLPPSCIPFSSSKLMNDSSTGKTVSPLDQGRPGKKRRQMDNSTASTNLSRPESQTSLESLPVGVKKESAAPVQILKKPRIDVNGENIPYQQTVQGLLFKGLQGRNTQLNETINQQREQNQQHQLIFPSVPHLRGVQMQVPKEHLRNMLQDLGNKVSFGTLVDNNLCSRRLMQYLYHLRSRPRDNSLVYWRKFVSEYYAPDSKKRWCFSTYSDDKKHATEFFYPKPLEPWCCDICGSRSGKGQEATFEALPRLLKTKFDSGILDEILFLDLPHAYFKAPSGLLVLEYRKAIQESIYENFRVVHEGKLRIIFRLDLKILSWEFCLRDHEEYLLRSLIAPQVDQLARSAQKFHNDIQNGVFISALSDDFHANRDRFVAAGHQLARSMDLSVVNGLGYPKTFARFLQIVEVLNWMKDLMAFSIERKKGPIESLNNYVQSCKLINQLEKQGMELFTGPQSRHIGHEHHANEYGYRMTDNELVSHPAKSTLDLADFNHQLFRRNASVTSMRRKGLDSYFAGPSTRSTCYDSQPLITRLHTDIPPCNLPSSPSELGKNYHRHLIDKMLQEMVASNRRGKSSQYANDMINNGSSCRSWPLDESAKHNRFQSTERSNASLSQTNLANASRNEATPHGILQIFSDSTIVKTEPRPPF
ncbi:probable transcriptional regulator SLK3 isoform X2 [Henckelia pumila]|uniref:probable transcriptional regulator SLK3 isoform X2 n=1 Tax=Henckelia pumila TaxID=405737 RepID=UPI003C6DB8B6